MLSGAVLFFGIILANNAQSNETTTNPDSIDSLDNKTYTASGSTDLKTAQMLVSLLRNPHLKVQAQAQIASDRKQQTPQKATDASYIAHGKTDRKTAQMLINLLRNPHLKVKAEINQTNKQDGIRYTISGTTDMKTVKKFKALLKNNKQVNITIQANNKAAPITLNANIQKLPQPQQYIYQDYSAIITQGKPFYHYGRPSVFIRGNTLWYPVLVTTQTPPKEPKEKIQKVSE